MRISQIVKLALGVVVLSATHAVAGACPPGAPADLAGFDDKTLSAFEDALIVPLADVTNASGDIHVSALDLEQGGPAFCVEFNTTLTCSNGIVTCALGVVLPGQAEPVLLLEAAHELTLSAPDAQGWPGIALMTRWPQGAQSADYHYCNGHYQAVAFSDCANPTEALKNG